MADDLRPTEGARFVLELADDRGAEASYRATIYTPDATYAGSATLHDDGRVDAGDAGGAPSELADKLATIAKLVARAAPKRRGDGLVVWPAHVMRWRGPGR